MFAARFLGSLRNLFMTQVFLFLGMVPNVQDDIWVSTEHIYAWYCLSHGYSFILRKVLHMFPEYT